MAKAKESIIPVGLPEMITSIGLGLAESNKKLMEATKDGPVNQYTMPEAEIELNVAFSRNSSQSVEAGVSASLFNVISINASYSGTFGFSETGSSRIKVKLKSVPVNSNNDTEQ